MAPKRGQKRRAAASGATANRTNGTKGNAALSPPDRDTWPGWVEMESEPAFFNVMLKEMGAHGVRIQEVYSMDEDALAVLPRPVHAFIFLFRYRTEDQQQQESPDDTDHIWFANQIPDFACATVALLNIVNNIPDLEMGKELRDFKEFTKDMDPMSRGDMIDNFDFVKRIHNSFASENDILNADMHTKNKFEKAKKRQATAKARATKEAKKAAQTPLKETTSNAGKSPRSSARAKKPVTKDTLHSSAASTPRSARSGSGSRLSSLPSSPEPNSDPDGDYSTSKKPLKITTNSTKNGSLRRSTRAPRPRKDIYADKFEAEKPEEGFHFIAYMPIGNHVWKLDGLDYSPTKLESVEVDKHSPDDGAGSDWMKTASPAILDHMLKFQDASIEFNLMAVVHDPAPKEKSDLVENVKILQAVDTKLTSIVEDWAELDDSVGKKDILTGTSIEFDMTQGDIDAVVLPETTQSLIATEDAVHELIKLRQRTAAEQAPLRAGLRDAIRSSQDDDEKARHRRHDYGTFARSWIGALAENAALGRLIGET